MLITTNIVQKGQWDDAIYNDGKGNKDKLCSGIRIVDVTHPITGEKVRGLSPNYMSDGLPMVLNRTEIKGKFTIAFFDKFYEIKEEKFVFPKMSANMWDLKEKVEIKALLTTHLGNIRAFLDHEWYKMPNKAIEVRWEGAWRGQFVGYIPGPSDIRFYIGKQWDYKTDQTQEILDFAKEHFGVDGKIRKEFSASLAE